MGTEGSEVSQTIARLAADKASLRRELSTLIQRVGELEVALEEARQAEAELDAEVLRLIMRALDAEEVLKRLASLPLQEWRPIISEAVERIELEQLANQGRES